MAEFHRYRDSKISSELVDEHIRNSANYISVRLAELMNDEEEERIQQNSGLTPVEYWCRIVNETIGVLIAQIDTVVE